MKNKDVRKAEKAAKAARKAAEKRAMDNLLKTNPDVYAQFLMQKRLAYIQGGCAIAAATIGGACAIVAANKGIQASRIEAKASQARIDAAQTQIK